MIIATIAAAEPARPLELFSGKYASVPWRSKQGPQARPQPNIQSGQPGIRFMCPPAGKDKRCFWDADISLNLSDISGISFSVKVSKPSAISRGTLYLHSGNGWYGGWFKLSGSGLQKIRIMRTEFSAEGDPAGWDKIDQVRIALWKGDSSGAVVTISDPGVWNNKVVVLYNSHAVKTHPEEKSLVNHAVEDVENWYKSIGIEVGRLNDNDIAGGIPDECKLIILPHNPYPADTTTTAIKKFTARGGRIIAAYSLDPELAALLGLSGKQWMRTGDDAKFTSIQLNADRKLGFPLSMRQDSWNANIPEIKDAKVIGLWKNGAGKTGSLPAVTINTNGIFIGHLLRDIDSENKTQFLLAAAIALRPELKAPYLKSTLGRAEKLFALSNWQQTQAFIKDMANKNGRERQTNAAISAIEQYRRTTAAILGRASVGELITRASVTRKMIQQAYFNAVSNRGVPNEFRGIWCHDAQGVPGMEWNEVTAAMKDAGFNALFPNMLWTGCAFYPSSIVPGPQATNPRQGNLLKKCLKACRKQGIELHLWKVCWNLSHASPAFIEKMRSEGRLQQKADGSSSHWLCPSDPRNRNMELSAAVEAVRKYHIDGIHYDYIRYPDSESCYCDGCHSRFEAATKTKIKNWPAAVISGHYKETFQRWRRDRITLFVAESSRALKAVRKDIQFSAAVFGSWPSCRDSVGQDWVTWAKRGYVDFLCTMNYVADDNKATELITKQLKDVGRTIPVYPGLGPSAKGLPPEQVVHQVDLIREAGAKGFILFDMDKDLIDSHLPALRSGATAE